VSFVLNLIKKIERDVKSFTSGILSLYNNSEVSLADLSKTEFKDSYGYFDEKNFRIYVNSSGLDERRLKVYGACVISFFQPWAFYLENTEEGQLLKEKTDEKIKEVQEVFIGIGKWVEFMSLRHLEELGYAFDYEVKSSYENYRNLDGFKVCQELWENSRKLNIKTLDLSGNPLDLEKVQRKVIRVLIKNIGKESNPDLFLRELRKRIWNFDEVLDLYLNSGEYALRKPKDVLEIEKYCREIKSALAFNSTFKDYKKNWEPLNKTLKNFGLKDLHEKSSRLFEYFSKNLMIDQKLSELEKDEEERLKNNLRELLLEIEILLASYKDEESVLITL
jgi:hypothetical protein